jgi:hypothetical protein
MRSIEVKQFEHYEDTDEEGSDEEHEGHPDEIELEDGSRIRTPLDDQLDTIANQFTMTNIATWQQQDIDVKKIIDKWKTTADPLAQIKKVFKVENDILYINNKELQQRTKKKNARRNIAIRREWAIYIPNYTAPDTDISIKWHILRQYHGLPTPGHIGITGTYYIIRQRFFWPKLRQDVTRWIASCAPCQQRKFGKQNSQGTHKSVLQTRPFETISIDLVGPFPETVIGNTYILTIIDHFTRYPIAIPIPDKKPETVAKALKTHVFLAFPFWPTKILSDKGSEFVNPVITELYKQLGVKRILTSHDNAQANQVERFHRYMSAAISCFLRHKKRWIRWEQYLDCAVYVYRCTVNNMTGVSPFYALYGRHPIRPLDYILDKVDERRFTEVTEYTEQIIIQLRDTYIHMRQNQINMALANTKPKENKIDPNYTPGDMVWVWRRYKPKKLEWRYEGPHTITKRNNTISYDVTVGTYKTNRPATATKPKRNKGDQKIKTVTIRHLRPYSPFEEGVWDTSPQWLDDDNPHTSITDILTRPKPIQQLEEKQFAILPYWAWGDVLDDKTPFTLVQILQIVGEGKNKHIIIRRYGNTKLDPLGPQRPGWIDTATKNRRTDYRTQPKKKYVAYTNDIDQLNLKTKHKLFPDDLICSGFDLDKDQQIPTDVLTILGQHEYFRQFKDNPFKYP